MNCIEQNYLSDMTRVCWWTEVPYGMEYMNHTNLRINSDLALDLTAYVNIPCVLVGSMPFKGKHHCDRTLENLFCR